MTCAPTTFSSSFKYLATEKKRLDGRDGGIAASTVKRYTTVFRSIVTMAYIKTVSSRLGHADITTTNVCPLEL